MSTNNDFSRASGSRDWAAIEAELNGPGLFAAGSDDPDRKFITNVRRLVAVTTHGSSKWVNAIEGESGKRTITRSLRSLCHPRSRATWIAMYGVDVSSAEQRARFLDRVERRVARVGRS